LSVRFNKSKADAKFGARSCLKERQ